MGRTIPVLLISLLLGSTAAIDCAQGRGLVVLHDFAGGEDGWEADGGLIRDRAGNLYGTTFWGGSTCESIGCGVVYEIGPDREESILHAFQGGTDGWGPQGALAIDKAGNLYGATWYGGNGCGNGGCGTIFKLVPDGTETILYAFTDGSDGEDPGGGVIVDKSGNLYGTTAYGPGTNCGGAGCGALFELAPNGNLTVLHSFLGGIDGAGPIGTLIRDKAGNLYGTTLRGGSTECGGNLGCGTIFKEQLDGSETLLHVFEGGTDGAYPYAGLISDSAGNLYGTTEGGGGSGCGGIGCGTIFKLSAGGNETVLYVFQGGTDGASSSGTLIADAVGNLYGTTDVGGNSGCNGAGCGTIFELAANGTESVLYRFAGRHGKNPAAGLIMDGKGDLYSTTVDGGSGRKGVVFKFNH